jgi:transcriptional regulator with XRE-family HTH domain
VNTWRHAYLRTVTALRQARSRLGISQADAGLRIGRSARTIMRFEAGETDIQVAHLFALADMMGVAIDVTVLSPAPAPADKERAS